MLIDACQCDSIMTMQADICIVGAGIAGLALASEFLLTRHQVIVLESGNEHITSQSQSWFKGRLTGAPAHPLTQSRVRAYGGSGTRWTGQCIPMQAIDFEKRHAIADSGWPVTRTQLEPYYQRAQAFFGLINPHDDVNQWQEQQGRPLQPATSDLLSADVTRFARPLDVGQSLKASISNSHNVNVYINAPVTNLELSADEKQLATAQVKLPNSGMLRFKAGAFILACGGVENSRLLLASNHQRSSGLGNEHDNVGRYFMDHPYLTPGYWRPSSAVTKIPLSLIENFAALAAGDCAAHAVYTLNETVRRSESLLGCGGYFICMENYETSSRYFSRGSQALVALADKVKRHRLPDNDMPGLISDLLKDPGSVLSTLQGRVHSVLKKQTRYALRLQVEASPLRHSRITLTTDKDAAGIPEPCINWQMCADDWRSVDRFRQVFAEAIESQGLGQLIDDTSVTADGWPSSMQGGKHHMGGTRMHDDQRLGVVDKHLRVHSLPNCYVTGSSVFPTGSWVNPTLTLTALTIRLADHLKQSGQQPKTESRYAD